MGVFPDHSPFSLLRGTPTAFTRRCIKKKYLVSRKLRVARVWVTLSLLTGCATFQAKPLSPADTASAFESRSLSSPQLREFLESSLHHEVIPWPPQSWDFPMLCLCSVQRAYTCLFASLPGFMRPRDSF
jgi:hypothetical protein